MAGTKGDQALLRPAKEALERSKHEALDRLPRIKAAWMSTLNRRDRYTALPSGNRAAYEVILWAFCVTCQISFACQGS